MGTQDVTYYYPSLSYDVAGSNHGCYKLQAEAEQVEKTTPGRHLETGWTESSLTPEASAHLCEVDWSVFGNAVSIFAGKHPTITSIHLLWNFLRDQKQ